MGPLLQQRYRLRQSQTFVLHIRLLIRPVERFEKMDMESLLALDPFRPHRRPHHF